MVGRFGFEQSSERTSVSTCERKRNEWEELAYKAGHQPLRHGPPWPNMSDDHVRTALLV